MNTGGGFVKAYTNNWLSQFGIYKYESPMEPPEKPNNQHRKIALYGILAMAFILFFIVFVIVNQTTGLDRLEVDTNQLPEGFSNETSIESSMGHTVLTTPLSANNNPANGTFTVLNKGKEEIAEAQKQRRIRRLGEEGSVLESSDDLVVYPSAYLKPPRLGSMRRFSDDFDSKEFEQPRPFRIDDGLPIPVGFKKINKSYTNNGYEIPEFRVSPGTISSIQNVLRQLSSSRTSRQNHFSQYMQQPAEFNNPLHQNHRLKFTGIYRHPRKNGEITTLFADSSKQHELHVAKPQNINSQLTVPGSFMPDLLYNFKPSNPSDVNLLATEQFRFAPEKESKSGNLPKGMPFSVMLDIAPVQAEKPRVQVYRKPFPNYSYVSFPSYFNNQNFAQVKHNAISEQPDDSYFRRSMPYYNPFQNLPSNLQPGKLMVHFNLYPKPSDASRRFELEKTALDINHLKLNTGEILPDPEADKFNPATVPERNFLERYFTTTPSTSSTTQTTPLAGTTHRINRHQDQERLVTTTSFPIVTNGHAGIGSRYPPYKTIERRDQRIEVNDKQRRLERLDSEERSQEAGFRPPDADLISFGPNDAV
ncbi:uncharacterized protein LOC129752676 [Uranotaenia lowii]|uniref:uncharacterized protein LOC129752676 n=1 Tax=Uranotaenia lowii TaxID=190385 RepID=UPI00247B0041|nr:uncharacterized protein LOC129752676 [Uranotaenia lowii]